MPKREKLLRKYVYGCLAKKQEKTPMIWRLVYAVHNADNYIVHTLVSILSAIKCFRKTSFTIHILHSDTVGDEWNDAIDRICKKFSTTITLHCMPKIDRRIVDLCDVYSEASLYRIFIPDIFDGDFVIYTDSDICFNICFDDIVSYVLRSRPFSLGAVKDGNSFVEHMYAYLIGKNIDPHLYFNSGFLVFNIKNIKSHFPDFSKRIQEILIKYNGLSYPDQDALNILLCNHKSNDSLKNMVLYMPEKFNFNINRRKMFNNFPKSLKNINIHYAGIKPWQDAYPASIYYWRNREELFSICGLKNHMPNGAGL